MYIAQYNHLPTMSDVTEVISLYVYTYACKGTTMCVCAYCGEHNTSVTGPDHPVQHTYRRCPTTAVPSACARAVEIVCRGRVLPSLLHGSQTQVSRVSFMPVDPTSYNILPIEYCVYTQVRVNVICVQAHALNCLPHRGRLRTSLPISLHSHPVCIKCLQVVST